MRREYNLESLFSSYYAYTFKQVAQCLVFGTMVLMAIASNDQIDIWCLDLMTNKCIKSKVSIPGRIAGTTEMKMMVSSDFYLYCIQYVSSTRKDYKKKLSDIIPREFYKTYRERESPVISAYCSQSEEECDLMTTIPVDVTRIILRMYPVFG